MRFISEFLKHIEFFPIKTRISSIQKKLGIDIISERTENLLNNFFNKYIKQLIVYQRIKRI